MKVQIDISAQQIAKQNTYTECIDVVAAKLLEATSNEKNYYLNTIEKLVRQRMAMIPVEQAFPSEILQKNMTISGIIMLVENPDTYFSYDDIKIPISALEFLIKANLVISNDQSFFGGGKYQATDELCELVNKFKEDGKYYFTQINERLIKYVLNNVFNFIPDESL